MIEELRGDAHAAEIVDSLGEVVIFDAGSQLAQLHGEIRVLHLARENFGQRAVGALRRAHYDAIAGFENGREKRESLDVIPMRVAEQDGRGQRFRFVGQQVIAQRAGTRAAIEDEALPGPCYYFHAGSISSIAGRRRPRRGNGSTSPPETQ